MFLGWTTGDAYWRKIAEWDVVLMLSDYEGFSRAVMECMCAGVIPVHPEFSAAAKELLGPATTLGLYPTGDVAAAADRINALANLPPEQLLEVRMACRRHIVPYSAERYECRYLEFLRRITDLPPRATTLDPPWWHEWLPLSIFTRLFPSRF